VKGKIIAQKMEEEGTFEINLKVSKQTKELE